MMWSMHAVRLWPCATILLAAGIAAVAEEGKLPEGCGLSAEHRGDRGIGDDPAVLLAEDFEKGEIADLSRKWTEVSNKDGKALAWAKDGPEGTNGKRCIQMTATLGQDVGGHLYAPLPRGVDTAYARFYVKFAEDAEYIHHFVWLGGHEPQTRWPNPRAGTRPEGNERFSVGIEPFGFRGTIPPPGAWCFYNYWHEMKISADKKYWGNGLRPAKDCVVPKGRWQCVEFMIKLNSQPDSPDGELALWLDGKPVAHFRRGARRGAWSGMGFQLQDEGGEEFEGFRWRTSTDLKVNYFWLEHYVTENAARQNGVKEPRKVNRVWFDDVVVATEYVGPIAK